jgi:hypothetical protein
MPLGFDSIEELAIHRANFSPTTLDISASESITRTALPAALSHGGNESLRQGSIAAGQQRKSDLSFVGRYGFLQNGNGDADVITSESLLHQCITLSSAPLVPENHMSQNDSQSRSLRFGSKPIFGLHGMASTRCH